MKHTQELSNIKRFLEQEARKTEITFQTRLEAIRVELENRRKNDIQDNEVNHQNHTDILQANHEQALINLKNYYNDIILNNMTLITSLKVIYIPPLILEGLLNMLVNEG